MTVPTRLRSWFSACACLVALGPAAHAAPAPSVPVAAGAFDVSRAEAELSVHAIGMPDPIGIDPKVRVCRVSVRWSSEDAKWAPTVRDGCHPNLVDAATEGAGRWDIAVTQAPGRDRELFEYWYVFPEKDGDPVRVFVRQAFDQQLHLTVPGVDVLDWSVKGRVLPEYPLEAVDKDTDVTLCQVKIDVAPSGTPGDIEITECDDVFHAGLETNLRHWRFGTPQLDGVPFISGLTIGARFRKSVEDSGPPGTVELMFPPDADLGERSQGRIEESVVKVPIPKPSGPPLFMVDHRSYAEVGVYDLVWPVAAATPQERTCDVLWGVNSDREVWAWPETCDPTVRNTVIEAASAWKLMHGVIETGERLARFRGTLVFPPGGAHAELRLPADDLETPAKDLPEHVQTYVVAKAYKTVPPKLPRAFATEVTDPVVLCEMRVGVDPHGKPAEVASASCPGAFAAYAERAVRQWRWTPAESNGKPIASRVTVRIRFDQAIAGAATPSEG